jgi:hypothetical protein
MADDSGEAESPVHDLGTPAVYIAPAKEYGRRVDRYWRRGDVMSEWFLDGVARTLGSPMPRRRLLRLAR